jgi:hypothetical protein
MEVDGFRKHPLLRESYLPKYVDVLKMCGK